MATDTAQQKLARCHLRLMRSQAFCALSGILVCGESRICDSTATAYTDGWNKVYGRQFFESLTDKEAAFVVAHENVHVLLRQLTVWQSLFKKDPMRANQAADFVINQMIVDLDPERTVIQPPAGILLDRRYRGKDTGQVFRSLVHRHQAMPPALDEHGWQAANEVRPDELAERTRTLDRALRQGRMLANRLGGNTLVAIGTLTEARIDWREALRDFVQNLHNGRQTPTWQRPSRRGLAVGEYRPGALDDSMGPLVVAIDTSGSIRSTVLTAFVTELASLCETVTPERVDVLWWDTRVTGQHSFLPGDYAGLAAHLTPKGGGGTDPRCVFAHLAEHGPIPECLLMLTDGQIPDWGTAPTYPVLWATHTGLRAPWGVTLDLS